VKVVEKLVTLVQWTTVEKQAEWNW